MSRFYGLFGGGASPTPVEEKAWIVKDGVVQVSFDDTIYNASTNYTAAGTQWKYNSTDLLYHSFLTSTAVACGYATSSRFKLSKYRKLVMVGKMSSDADYQTNEIDLSNLSDNAYVVVSMRRTTGGNVATDVYIVSNKTNYASNSFANANFGSREYVAGTLAIIKDIYFIEKSSSDTDYYLAPINTLALTNPSSTTSSSSTKRTWTKNSLVKGVNQNNSYSASDVSSYSISGNTLTLTKTSGNSYGVGFVCNDNVVAGETYNVDGSTSNGKIYAVFYQSDGTFIGNIDVTTNGAFTVPSNTSYTLIECIMVGSAGTYTYTINGVTKATT